jgi:hypothetical protein
MSSEYVRHTLQQHHIWRRLLNNVWFSRWSPWYPKRQSSSWNPPGNPCFIACTGWGAPKIAGWWFQTFFIVYDIWDNHPNWLSYFSEWLRPPTRYTNAIKFEATCLTKHVISLGSCGSCCSCSWEWWLDHQPVMIHIPKSSYEQNTPVDGLL